MSSRRTTESRRAELIELLPCERAELTAFVSAALSSELGDVGHSEELLQEIGRAYLTSVLPSGAQADVTAFARSCADAALSEDTLVTLLATLQAHLVTTAEGAEAVAPSHCARVVGRDVAAVGAAFARAQSETASGVTSDVRARAEKVADRSTEIESLAEQQSSNMDELSREVGEISAAVEEVAASTEEINDQSDDAAALAEDGCAKVRLLDERIEEIHERAARVMEAIEVLVDQIDEIDHFVDTIDEIADQTNMLALNASIEAARVDGGDGFAVVADEVKSLAEDSQAEAARIRELVQRIEDATERVADDIDGVARQTEAGRRAVAESVDTFEDIEELTGRLSGSMSEIATATGQQAESTEELAMMADEASWKAEMIVEEVHEIKGSNEALRDDLERSLSDEP
ncbi:hypothetical protein DVK02_00825 [Halobellus sp. Atlit-31R]|nr:hypothetical protein DVK02_00825 [Halobellus sp. Atlit-31R]